MEDAPVQREKRAEKTSLPGLYFFSRIRFLNYKQIILLVTTIFLLLGSFALVQRPDALAASTGTSCSWYRIATGDTLTSIARAYHINVRTLAHANGIRNTNLIYTSRTLCIPSSNGARGVSGLQANGVVRWYDYSALDWSTQSEVAQQLRLAAARYGLPANLLLAIAWQESGWNQHVIARDGGIGTMQVMPYTAQGLNIQVRHRYDPYKLPDNILLGAIYLQSLWRGFHGNLTLIISAYNEGGWNVIHRGVFNWRYVNNVRALMNRF